jgi:putative sterol carrier protein
LQDDGQYTVKVEDGKMTIEEGLIGDPKCVVTASAATLGKVISGNMNPMMAVMSGKLKISNLTEMMTYAKIFGLKI